MAQGRAGRKCSGQGRVTVKPRGIFGVGQGRAQITRKNDAFDAEIVNTRLTKIFIAIFAPDERLPSSAALTEMNVALGRSVR